VHHAHRGRDRRLSPLFLAAALLFLACSPVGVATGAPPSAGTATETPVDATRDVPTGGLTPGPAATAASSGVPPAGGMPTVAWTRHTGTTGLETASFLSEVVDTGTRLVAIGARSLGTDESVAAGIWTSTDGTTWTAVEGFDSEGCCVIESLAMGPAGLIAVGGNGDGIEQRPAVWHSADGLAWELRPDPPVVDEGRLFRVVGGSAGYTAFGDRGTMWTSRDGSAWEQRSDDALRELGEHIVEIHSAQDAHVALTAPDPETQAPGGSWRSTDGVTWTRTGDIPETEDVIPTYLARTSAGYVALGQSEVGDTAAWRSVDGLTWERLPDPEAFGGAPVDALVGTLMGYLAVGTRGTDPGITDEEPDEEQFLTVLWSSTDGITWTELPADDALLDAAIDHLMQRGDGLLAVGTSYSAPDAEGPEGVRAVWTATVARAALPLH
jgi:hypothetical protein